MLPACAMGGRHRSRGAPACDDLYARSHARGLHDLGRGWLNSHRKNGLLASVLQTLARDFLAGLEAAPRAARYPHASSRILEKTANWWQHRKFG